MDLHVVDGTMSYVSKEYSSLRDKVGTLTDGGQSRHSRTLYR